MTWLLVFYMCPVCFDVYVLLTMWWDMMCESVYCLSMRCEVRKGKRN